MTPSPSTGALRRVLTRLTDRDRHLLRLLDEHRAFTTEQIRQLGFWSSRHARERLTTLTQIEVLARFRGYTPVGSEPYKYTLGPLGATIVAYEQGKHPPKPSKINARIDALTVSQHLPHLLGVNGFFTALVWATRTSRADCDLVDRWPERQCAERLNDIVRPDGHGIWFHGDRAIRFWLEYDNGTETLDQVAGKLSRYADLAVALKGRVLVLFWFPGPRRENNARAEFARQVAPRVDICTANPAFGTPADRVWLPLPATSEPNQRLHLNDLIDLHATPSSKGE